MNIILNLAERVGIRIARLAWWLMQTTGRTWGLVTLADCLEAWVTRKERKWFNA